ncbi:MAG: FGGY family carbohydrate kinase [Steroidobacterales bacterium]
MMHGVLALDQGGHASRACIFDLTGAVVAEARVPVRTLRPATDQIEQDPQELLESLQQAALQALACAPQLQIEQAGLATQRSTLVCCTRAGEPLSNALSWQDRRNAAWLEGYGAQSARITALTGLPLSPHYGVAKMRWCLDHLPRVQAARARADLLLAPLAAFLVQRLTRADARLDPANASRTLLWDSIRRDWSDELLDLFGIDRALLPICTPTCMDFGSLPHRGVRLTACTGDQSAIPYAFGPPDTDTVYVNLGTGAFIQRPQAVRPIDAAPLLASVLCADAQGVQYCVEGTVNGAGGATSLFAAQRGADEAELWRELECQSDEAPLPLFLNGVGGLGSPYWRPLRSRFIGDGGPLQCFAAVVESIVFLIALNFDAMRRSGRAPRRLIVSGGLSRSDWLCRRLAGVLQLPVVRAAVEATLRGAAALAAPEIAQQWPSLAGETFSPELMPQPAERYLRFRAQLEQALGSPAR